MYSVKGDIDAYKVRVAVVAIFKDLLVLVQIAFKMKVVMSTKFVFSPVWWWDASLSAAG